MRGIGAMRAIELVRDRGTKEPADVVSAGTLGNVIRLLVPLTATDEQIREGLNVLEHAVGEVPSTGRN
jgi:4-aminobutyrate aminotransferase/(S)-3-amino-2-methylpropionate transaminase